MDWSSVVSIAITGVVGIAGVAGAIVSARMASTSATKDLKLSIRAENDRVNKAEKRRIYAAFQTSVESMLRAAINDGIATEPEEKKEARAALETAHNQMYLKFNELWLIAPTSVKRSAYHIMTHFNEYAHKQEQWMGEFSILQAQSVDAMRADVDETS